MSLNLGAIFIKHLGQENLDDVLLQLRLKPINEIDFIRIEDALSKTFDSTAIGFYHGDGILINHSLPYDCTPIVVEYSQLDEDLMQLSLKNEVLCIYLHSISDTYGHALYKGGNKIKCRAFQDGEVQRDDALKELPIYYHKKDTTDEEEYNLQVIRGFLGYSLNNILRENDLKFQVYASNS